MTTLMAPRRPVAGWAHWPEPGRTLKTKTVVGMPFGLHSLQSGQNPWVVPTPCIGTVSRNLNLWQKRRTREAGCWALPVSAHRTEPGRHGDLLSKPDIFTAKFKPVFQL